MMLACTFCIQRLWRRVVKLVRFRSPKREQDANFKQSRTAIGQQTNLDSLPRTVHFVLLDVAALDLLPDNKFHMEQSCKALYASHISIMVNICHIII